MEWARVQALDRSDVDLKHIKALLQQKHSSLMKCCDVLN